MNNINQMFSNPQFRQILQSKNPQQAILQIARNSNNPMSKRAVEFFQNGDWSGLEQYARNIMKSSGQDPDQIMNAVKGLMNIK